MAVAEQEQAAERQRWFKITRVDTRGKILDLTDPDPFPSLYDMDDERQRKPKFAFNYTLYNIDSFASLETHRHYMDEDVLELLCWDILTTRKGEPTEQGYTPLLQEFKGGPARAAGVTTLGDNGVVSRSMEVRYMDKLKGEPLRTGPVYSFHWKMTEGKEGGKGQITPVQGSPVFLDQTMMIPVPLARKMAKQVLGYLESKRTAALVGHHLLSPIWQQLDDMNRA